MSDNKNTDHVATGSAELSLSSRRDPEGELSMRGIHEITMFDSEDNLDGELSGIKVPLIVSPLNLPLSPDDISKPQQQDGQTGQTEGSGGK